MQLKAQTFHTLQVLNTLLMQGDMPAMQACLEQADLAELLSDDTLSKARAYSKPPLVILLASLAVSNDINVPRATWWRDVYQSIARGQLLGQTEILPSSNVIRQIALSIGQKTDLSVSGFSKLTGTSQQWIDAFEMAFDHQQWDKALGLIEALGHRKTEKLVWINIAKSLVSRHKELGENAGHVQVARMYELIQYALRHAGANEASKALLFLRGRSLQDAGEYAQALDVFQQLQQQGSKIAGLVEAARCHSKQGQLAEAIRCMDQVLEEPERFSKGLADPELMDALVISSPNETNFNVGNANQALSDLVSVLGKIGLKIFLVSGTLLGYERDGKLMDHDKDIDVGMLGWEGQYDAVMALLNSSHFRVLPKYLKGNDTYYIPMLHLKTGVSIDLFVYHEVAGQWVTGVDFAFGYRQTFAFTPFELKAIRFLDVDMYVPENAALNLEENFGNWRTPDPGYISHLESPSTMDKGGLAHMLAARLWAVRSIQAHNVVKLRKVIEVLESYPDAEGAISPKLLDRLKGLLVRFEKDNHKPAPEEKVEKMELAHA